MVPLWLTDSKRDETWPVGNAAASHNSRSDQRAGGKLALMPAGPTRRRRNRKKFDDLGVGIYSA